ncbi:hypothetical protein GQ457_14G018790 [Hibiscus cannabinus]
MLRELVYPVLLVHQIGGLVTMTAMLLFEVKNIACSGQHAALININGELVECGEYHSCAVSLSGEMYSWGGSSGNSGLLGHGSETSQQIPNNLNGSLEGIHASSVSCGPWHTAVVTSTGQLFTFGDGTFGVLGHGDRKSGDA